jgi:hypothetical protein
MGTKNCILNSGRVAVRPDYRVLNVAPTIGPRGTGITPRLRQL